MEEKAQFYFCTSLLKTFADYIVNMSGHRIPACLKKRSIQYKAEQLRH